MSCELCGPPIELTNGDILTLRHGTVDDGPALVELYDQLDPNDLTRRFFTAGAPSSRFIDHWAGIEAEGGLGLVAELTARASRHLVGEAGYAPISGQDGEGELGITVRPGSRGWLGPWLLDRLLAHARARGVKNLQAVVLVDNRTMIRLAAKRGYAVLGHPDWGTVRLTLSTDGPVPSWPGPHDKPRVLVETNLSRWGGEHLLTEAGYQVVLCGAHCRGVGGCPVLQGDACPLIEGADVVVVDLPDTADAVDLFDQERLVHPGIKQVLRSPSGGGEHERLAVTEVLEEIQRLLAEPVEGAEEEES